VAEPTGQWRCSGASVVGRSHEREGSGCQDVWCMCRSNNGTGGVLAVCVCDGAGRAKNARAGAELVSSSLARWLATHFDRALFEPEDALYEAIFEVREAMGQRAEQSRESLDDYACTVVAVATRDDGQWVAWHLGDGGIIVQFADAARVLSPPKRGEFANVTYFITDADAYEQVDRQSSRTCAEAVPPLGFALFTDGVESRLILRKTGAVAPAVPRMLGWHESADEEQVSNAVRYNLQDVLRDPFGDDCTLVLLRWRLNSVPIDPVGEPDEQVV